MNTVLTDIKELINISSVTSDKAGVTRALKYAVSMFPPGFDWKKKTKRGHAPFWTGRKITDPDRPVIILSGHLDTVFAAHEVSITDTDGRLSGSGTQDMKGSVAVMAEVARQVQDANLIIALSPEEELGPQNAYVGYIQQLAQEADYIFVFESTLDTKPAAPVSERSIVTSRKGFYKIKYQIAGPGGHSGVITKKEDRHNCINHAADLIRNLQLKVPDYSKGTTFNIGTIQGGTSFNVLADNVEMVCEIRYRDDAEPARFLDAIKQVCDSMTDKHFQVDFDVMIDFPPLPETTQSRKFAKKLQQIYRSNGSKLSLEQRGGGSEANFFFAGNPQAVILDGFGIRGDKQHTRGEFLLTASIEPTVSFALTAISAANGQL